MAVWPNRAPVAAVPCVEWGGPEKEPRCKEALGIETAALIPPGQGPRPAPSGTPPQAGIPSPYQTLIAFRQWGPHSVLIYNLPHVAWSGACWITLKACQSLASCDWQTRKRQRVPGQDRIKLAGAGRAIAAIMVKTKRRSLWTVAYRA